MNYEVDCEKMHLINSVAAYRLIIERTMCGDVHAKCFATTNMKEYTEKMYNLRCVAPERL